MLILSIILILGLILFLFFKKKKNARILKLNQINQYEMDFYLIDEWIKKDKKYLDKNIKVQIVATNLNLSEKQVSRAINVISGCNFNLYINKLRIKEAEKMLLAAEYNHYTIDAIGELAGFSNKVSFYNAFKKVTSKSPTEYKKLVKHVR